MENLSQNELNQIGEMRNQSQDELQGIAKIRRIKNYEGMSKEKLIISLLKSKRRIAQIFNNNDDDYKISDIGRILNRLRDILPKRKLKKSFMKQRIMKIFHKQKKKKMMNILEN